MRINSIDLLNFGSYEGKAFFDTKIDNIGKGIILIGGKNGAGKTTLFTAIRLSIYGYKAFGYQAINAFYNRSIIKLINNNAKLKKPAISYVEVNIAISNGQDFDNYIIHREWTLNKDNEVNEKLKIKKNDQILEIDEIYDFEKYLMQIIPPELFNLYFFDGERIADFFLDEGSNARIKNAFLTLCGYDTFDIMSKNFKRISGTSSANKDVIERYLIAKDEVQSANKILENLNQEIGLTIFETELIDANITKLDSDYNNNGGVTQKIWNERFSKIRVEESKRDEDNAWLKKVANDTIPFLILQTEIVALKEQIEKERDREKFEYFSQQIEDEQTKTLLLKALQEIDFNISADQLSNVLYDLVEKMSKESFLIKEVLGLSTDQISEVIYTINRITNFDEKGILKAYKRINMSIKRSQMIRAELEKCNIDAVNDYVKSKNILLLKKDELINRRFDIEEKVKDAELRKTYVAEQFLKIQKEYEDELKKNSINDISLRAIMLLDKLTVRLFETQIKKVETTFRKEINTLMRNSNFINNISIDNNFNIRIYRSESYSIEALLNIIDNLSGAEIEANIGTSAFQVLERIKTDNQSKTIVEAVKKYGNNKIVLPIEMDKNSLSNGEKQIFIMALYKSLIQLCNHEVPFVIDTPFARIDTEHRQNIAKYFFKELKGQVFILSTNEEINSEHVEVLNDKIIKTFMLENPDNKKTEVYNNLYFEVK